MNDKPILSVNDLRVDYRTGAGQTAHVIRGIDLELYERQSLALVGESGCGKSTLALSLLRLLPKLGRVTGGSVTYRGADGTETDVLGLNGRALRGWRWSEVAMVFQGAMNAFNPVLKIYDQFADTMRAHADSKPSKKDVYDRAAAVLESVRLDPARVLPSYPHELSGGMRQRVLIALSLLLEPRILVLDEPTTALDLLTQRAIVDMLHELRAELGFAMIFVSHDLPLASELADRVCTMYAGRVIETGTVADTFTDPRHPYTVGLIRAVPPVHAGAEEPISIPGTPPDLADLPAGCTFRQRCAWAVDECAEAEPGLESVTGRGGGMDHAAACLRWDAVRLHDPEVSK
ncbi:MAG TPA: ABC transporter ATP-binding protein [Stackebrandtia sp.]|uniref:ABC transporter ATP-binding protein n=1 Tax=Stackebrandtia sp. TaxID=2023065 RepID=UPI002D74C2B7|nr:ABC transporter ATP-binding protein [Stackebrandtia sp.]HZE39281.1 ABC transporter ATP-binding protein [Stackebrandtia sp.]